MTFVDAAAWALIGMILIVAAGRYLQALLQELEEDRRQARTVAVWTI